MTGTRSTERKPSRPGRPPGTSTKRAAILQAAHELFSAQGYEQTSIRQIARQAEVDPALVRHYFSDKTTLFLAAAQISFDPRLLVKRLAAGGRAGMGERILAVALPIWESPMGRSVVVAGQHEPKLLVSFVRVISEAISSAAEQTLGELSPAERTVRIAMVQSTLSGLFATRYLAELELVANLPPAVIVKRWAPLLQRIIDHGA